ncbi:MAG: hypothetical protein KDD82_19285, partial [Planctomycetes bacterium]|nr:hypothetical protein [Planctomycetota bacterium]
AVLLLGEFLPTRHFGLLVGSSIAAALLGDLFMLPALLRVVYAWGTPDGTASASPPSPDGLPPETEVG